MVCQEDVELSWVQLFFAFPLFQDSLAYITIPKNNGKIKINWNQKLAST